MKRLAKVIKVAVVALIFAYGFSFAGQSHFMLDNLSSFQVHFAVTFLACTVLLLLAREKAWIGVAAFAFVVSLSQLAPWYVRERSVAGSQDDRSITVLSSNVLARSKSGHRLAELVLVESPELLGVVELTPAVVDVLGSIRESYPHHFEASSAGTTGLGLYSRLPISDARLLELGDELPPAISATLVAGQAPVDIILVHPNAPMTRSLAAMRNRQLELLARHIRNSDRPTIVMGDLNIAMWSPYYKEFVAASGLRNARDGYGIAGTWPALSGLGVPIDHILGSPEIGLSGFRVLPSVGSDHFPIAAQVLLPGTP